MDIVIKVFLPLALAFIMFSLGLGLTIADFIRVFRRPKAFGIGAFNQVILLPVVAFASIAAFGVKPEMAVGVMILAACPGGVTSNVIAKFGRADVALSVSLTAVISILSTITMPVLIVLSMTYFLKSEAVVIDVTSISLKLFILTFIPIVLGITVRHYLPKLTNVIEPAISAIATVLFGVFVLAALFNNWDVFTDNIAGIGVTLVVMNTLLLFLGFAIARSAGLSLREAKTISIETGIQNPLLGITAATLIVAGDQGFTAYSIPSAIYGITMYVVTLPLVMWFRTSPRKQAEYAKAN